MAVKAGELVRAWSSDGDWLYGEKVTVNAEDGTFDPVRPRQRGWFPEECVVGDSESDGSEGEGESEASDGDHEEKKKDQ